MHSGTSLLKQKIEECSGSGLLDGPDNTVSSARNGLLNNAYQGETAYILTCGPSLGMVWQEGLQAFLQNKLVIGVKQAQHLAPGLFDFHLYNEVRMETYCYHGDTIRLSVSKFQDDHPSHIHYPIKSYRYEEALFCTNEYARWTLDRSLQRPWGIGIMFELGLHLPIYLGCKKIVIIGFDMNASGAYHFYDAAKNQDSAYYNVDEEEFDYAVRSSGVYYQWAKSLGVEVVLCSPLSTLEIPQIKTSDLFSDTLLTQEGHV